MTADLAKVFSGFIYKLLQQNQVTSFSLSWKDAQPLYYKGKCFQFSEFSIEPLTPVTDVNSKCWGAYYTWACIRDPYSFLSKSSARQVNLMACLPVAIWVAQTQAQNYGKNGDKIAGSSSFFTFFLFCQRLWNAFYKMPYLECCQVFCEWRALKKASS